MEIYNITVNKTRDPDLEEEQVKLLQENLNSIKFIDSMKTSADRIVFEYVKLMLAPTGKKITYSPAANEAFSTRTLGELVADYNDKVKLLES